MKNTDNSPHWKESDLLDRLYGLDPVAGLSARHLDECPECALAWAALATRRNIVLSSHVQISDEQLRVQRQTIWARIDQPGRAILWRAMPAGAMALLLFVGVALHQAPAPWADPAEGPAVSDTQLFTEIASVVNQDSPRAADPIRGLFLDDAAVEAQ